MNFNLCHKTKLCISSSFGNTDFTNHSKIFLFILVFHNKLNKIVVLVLAQLNRQLIMSCRISAGSYHVDFCRELSCRKTNLDKKNYYTTKVQKNLLWYPVTYQSVMAHLGFWQALATHSTCELHGGEKICFYRLTHSACIYNFEHIYSCWGLKNNHNMKVPKISMECHEWFGLNTYNTTKIKQWQKGVKNLMKQS